jgi:hypothetical protein
MTTGITHQKKNSLKWLTGLSVVVLLVILFFGLRPEGFNFSNSVSRIDNQAGIRFSKYGIAYTDPIEELRKKSEFGENGFSVEIALKPLSAQEGFNFIFALHNGNDRNQLLVGQWRSWIIAMNGDDYDHKRRVKRISADIASQSSKIRFLTITTGKDGTNVYIDGQLIRTERDLTLSIPYGDNARLLLGNSVYGRNSWQGEIYGLAFYGYSLAGKDVGGHFHRWSESRNFNFAGEDLPAILYLFDEKEGTRAFDHAGGNHDLQIPSGMQVLERKILAPPWHGFEFNRSLIQDMVVNLIGFIPLGFVLLATFYKAGPYPEKHGFLITIAICFTVSLAIEILQAWIPSRSSDSLDLMLNTLGGFMGAKFSYYIMKGSRLKGKIVD